MNCFLLTRQWQQSKSGLLLSFWATDGNKPIKIQITDHPSVCFINHQQSIDLTSASLVQQRKPLELRNFADIKVDGLYFANQHQLNQFVELARKQGITLYESDIKPTDRFLMERFITASCQLQGGEVSHDKQGNQVYLNPLMKAIEFKPEIKWLSLDIETDVTASQLYSIAVYAENASHVFMLSDQPLAEHPDLSWTAHKTEKGLLISFFDWIADYDPDLIIGWNIVGFDLVVLEQICARNKLTLRLGRGHSVAKIFKPRRSGEMHIAQIQGRAVMDGIEILRAAFYSFESFSLDFVAGELLGKHKLIDDIDKPAQITHQFNHDKPQLARYNLEDCRLVAQIFEKTQLIEFAMQRSAMTGLAFGRVGGSIAAFDNLYLPCLHRQGRVANNVNRQNNSDTSPGGYVLESMPGLYENILLLDFKSLYPSIIRTFRIDPLGLIEPGENPIAGFLGASFSRHNSILPNMIDSLWARREQAKADKNAALSQAVKIIMNSFYGVLGAQSCRFYNPQLATSITRRGHEIIRKSKDFVQAQGHQVIYGDTDSIFILLGENYSQTSAKQRGAELTEQLNQYWKILIEQQFNLISFLEVEFEILFARFYMPTIRGSQVGSKKRYAGWVSGAADGKELVVKGLEAVRTDWTPFARQAQTEVLARLFKDQPVHEHIKSLSQGLYQGEFDKLLFYRKRLRRDLNSYIKNVPPHVQAARKQTKPSRTISYMITHNGPEPESDLTAAPDYDHYLERQLRPAVEGILECINLDFDEIVQSQMRLF